MPTLANYKPKPRGRRRSRDNIRTSAPTDVRTTSKAVKGSTARAGQTRYNPLRRASSLVVSTAEEVKRMSGAQFDRERKPVRDTSAHVTETKAREFAPVLYIPPKDGYHIQPVHDIGSYETCTRSCWEALHHGHRPSKPVNLKASVEHIKTQLAHPSQKLHLPTDVPHRAKLLQRFSLRVV